jgi:excisionase family DNA binding protein
MAVTPELELAHTTRSQLMSLEVVGERLAVGRSTVYKLVGSGALLSVKIGKRRLVSEAALADYVASLGA